MHISVCTYFLILTYTYRHTDSICVCVSAFSYNTSIMEVFPDVNPIRHWGYKMMKTVFSQSGQDDRHKSR